MKRLARAAGGRKPGEQMVRMFVADDHELVRTSIRQILKRTDATWEVCGEAADGREAVNKARELDPDLIILDIVMPVLDGLSAAREIRAQLRHVPILIYTFITFPDLEVMAKEAGAQIVVQKGDKDALLAGIRRLLSSKPSLANETVSRRLKNRTGESRM